MHGGHASGARGPQNCDVLVAGGGPVGLAVAALLGRAGREVTVLEPRRQFVPRDESRAITWMPEGLLLADELGLTGELLARASIRVAHEFRRSPSGPALMRVEFDRLPHRHPYTANLPQHDSEALLERAALATGRVEVVREERVVALGQDESGVEAVTESAAGQVRRRGRLGVGADGARSARTGVAALLGIEDRFTGFGVSSAVADVEVAVEPADPGVSWVALDPRGPLGAFRFGDRRWRVIFRSTPVHGRHGDPPTVDEVGLRTAQALPGTAITRHLWSSSFRLGHGQAQRYRVGRWVLVGDAAHAMGPSAGAGMMVGLLGGWRLARELCSVDLGDVTAVALSLQRYEHGQRLASTSVQRSNALIFRNLAVRSPSLGFARNRLLSALGTIPAVTSRMAAREALVGLSTGPGRPDRDA